MDTPDKPKLGPPAWFRVKVKPGLDGKNEVWIQKRVWWRARDWYNADNRRRFAMLEFQQHLKDAEEMLRLFDESKKDVANTLRDAREEFSMNDGTSKWYSKPGVPREEALPDITKEFKALRKKFEGGFKPGGRHNLGGGNGTVSSYLPKGILPHITVEGKEGWDHTIGYEDRRPQQKQGSRNRGQRNKGNQQQKQGENKIQITLPDSNNDD